MLDSSFFEKLTGIKKEKPLGIPDDFFESLGQMPEVTVEAKKPSPYDIFLSKLNKKREELIKKASKASLDIALKAPISPIAPAYQAITEGVPFLGKMAKGFENWWEKVQTVNYISMQPVGQRIGVDGWYEVTPERKREATEEVTKDAIKIVMYYDLFPKALSGTLRNVKQALKGKQIKFEELQSIVKKTQTKPRIPLDKNEQVTWNKYLKLLKKEVGKIKPTKPTIFKAKPSKVEIPTYKRYGVPEPTTPLFVGKEAERGVPTFLKRPEYFTTTTQVQPIPEIARGTGIVPQFFEPIKVGLGGRVGGEVGLGGLPATPPEPTKVTQAQLGRGHILAKEKLFLSPKGKIKPQYRRLAKGMTGKTSMAKMTEAEAEDFINALEKLEPRVIRGERLPPRIPTTKRIAPAEFFKREFKKPSLLKFITPSDRYARSLGTYELIEPFIKSKTKMILETRKLYKWLDIADKQISKFGKTGIIEKGKEFIIRKPTTAKREWMRMLDTYKTGAEAGLKGEQRTLFNQMRELTDNMLARTNEVREVAGLPPIKGIRAYVTHIKDIVGKLELREKYPFPEEIKYWLTRVQSKHIYNPTALHRLIQNMETTLQDPIKALKAMTAMDLKQIYLEYPNIIFREQMNALKGQIPADTRKWTEAYVNEVIKGYPTKLDNLTNASLEKIGIPQAINWILKPFGRGLGANPSKQIAGTIGRLVHDATIWGRAKLVIRNHLQKFLGLGLYDSKAFIKSFLPANKESRWMTANSDFLQISRSEFMEALPQGVFSKIERAGFLPYGHSHVSNVKQSMKVAYHAGMELVNNPKYKGLGWTKEDVMKEMEYGANTTQYWYNLMGMPELYRSGALRALGTLQSWWQNYTMKYWRELLYRGFKGKTGWGKPIPFKWRVGALRHIVVSLLLVEGLRRGLGLDYKRTVLLGTLPGYLSPPGQIITGLYKLVTADNERQRKSAMNQIKYSYRAFIPGSMAWKDWMKAWDERNLKGLLFYEEKQLPIKSFEKREIGVGIPDDFFEKLTD